MALRASLSASIPKAVFKGFLALGGWEVGAGGQGGPEAVLFHQSFKPTCKEMPNSEKSCSLSAKFRSLALSWHPISNIASNLLRPLTGTQQPDSQDKHP